MAASRLFRACHNRWKRLRYRECRLLHALLKFQQAAVDFELGDVHRALASTQLSLNIALGLPAVSHDANANRHGDGNPKKKEYKLQHHTIKCRYELA